MPLRAASVAAVLAAALALPAAAEGATLGPLKPCYATTGGAEWQREPLYLVAHGFTPGSFVDIFVDGTLHTASASIDAGGRLGAMTPASVPAPYAASGEREFEVEIFEQGNPANVAVATAKTTRLGVKVTPRNARLDRKVRFRGRGFTGGKPIYAHYLFKGKPRRTVKLARAPDSDCGTWSARRTRFPFRSPRVGIWTVQFDHVKAYVPQARPIFMILPFRVYKTRDED